MNYQEMQKIEKKFVEEIYSMRSIEGDWYCSRRIRGALDFFLSRFISLNDNKFCHSSNIERVSDNLRRICNEDARFSGESPGFRAFCRVNVRVNENKTIRVDVIDLLSTKYVMAPITTDWSNEAFILVGEGRSNLEALEDFIDKYSTFDIS